MQYQPDPFALDPSGVSPDTVPFVTLSNGQKMPCVGLGTFGSDRFDPDQIAGAVKSAISVGYRSIDCASVYGNEAQIGDAIAQALQSGALKREELFITSKVWNDQHGKGDILLSCAKSLHDLQLDYLDLYLVHWPFPNYHPPFCTVDSRNPDSKPFYIEEFMMLWQQMERLVDMGLVKAIGTSNVTIPKMEQIYAQARIKPAVNEMELHPHFQDQALFDYMRAKNVQPIGFCPVGSPMRPDRDKMDTDTCDIQDPVMVQIAAAHNVHPAIICIKWAVQRGEVVIPFSINKSHFQKNLQCVCQDPLSADEMQAISKIDRNCRLVKGHVFLWEGADSWENLWDLNGSIDRTGFAACRTS